MDRLVIIISFIAIWVIGYFYNATIIPFSKATKMFGIELFFNIGTLVIVFFTSMPMLQRQWDPEWYKKVLSRKGLKPKKV